MDEETGLYYNRFRYYDPESGAYTQRDPIGLMGENPGVYGYVWSTLVEWDPLGLSAASDLQPLKGKSIPNIEKTLSDAGFSQTKATKDFNNQTWDHPDGSQVRIHPYGNEKTTMKDGSPTPKSGLNAHVHKEDPSGNQLTDRGHVSTDPADTHIGAKNPGDYPAKRGRSHGSGH